MVPGDAAAAAVGDTGPAWERESLDRSVDGQSRGAAEHAHEPTPVLAAQEEAAPRHEAGMAGTDSRPGGGGDGGEKGLEEGEAAAAAAAVAGSRKHEEREKDEGESGEVKEEEDDDEDAAA